MMLTETPQRGWNKVFDGTAANFQAVLVKRKYCIMVAELLHGVELQRVGDISI